MKVLKDRRDFLIHELETIPHVRVAIPEGAFYLWVNIAHYMGKSLKGKKLETSDDLCKALLDDQLVAAVPGLEFGLDGYLRLSYALGKEQGKEAVQRMKTFFTSLT